MNDTVKMCSTKNLCSQLMQREMHVQSVVCKPAAFAANLFRQRYRVAKNLYKSDLRAHYGCVNAIEFSQGGKYLASGGDDKRVLIWDIEASIAGQQRPRVLDSEHTSNIFCLGFDRHNQRVFSGGNDDLVIVRDFETGKLANVFKHDNPVYGLSIDPLCDSIFATACEDGQILVFDQRVDPAHTPFVVAQLRASFHAVEFHPLGGNHLVTANSKCGAAFWDIRKPHNPVIQYGYVEDPPSCMSVRFNSNGSLILALRRRLPPILYSTQSPEPVCTFYHDNYYNSCTLKSCTFAGEDDEFVLSGSDDFNLYVWRVSDVDLECTDQWIESTQMVLYGHRSIVNQVRYNRQKCLLASSGVEKVIKLWSPFAQKGWTGSLLEEATGAENPRELYLPFNFSHMATSPHSWSHMSHDYTTRNTSEDPRMMAFFDSLIQQEIEGWETHSATESEDEPAVSSTHSTDSSCEEDDDNDNNDDDDDDDDDDDNPGDGREQQRPGRRLKFILPKRKGRNRQCMQGRGAKAQRPKYPNRIAFLIASKRNTLRRLAIKGASLSNNRLHHIVIVKGRASGTDAGTSTSTSTRTSNRTSTSINASTSASTSKSKGASTSKRNSRHAVTSTAAARPTAAGRRTLRHRVKGSRACETSSDEERSDPVASTAPIPSTSTGITSSFKDDIIRLRQQQQHIIDSDEDDDDSDQIMPTGRLQPSVEVVADPSVQPTKKLNGVRRSNGGANPGRSSSRHVTSSTTRRYPMSSLSTSQRRLTVAHTESDSRSSATASPIMLPQSRTNAAAATTSNSATSTSNGINVNGRQSRHCPHGAAPVINTYSSHTNSMQSSRRYQNDAHDSSTSSSSEQVVSTTAAAAVLAGPMRRRKQQTPPPSEESTPAKRRKTGRRTVHDGDGDDGEEASSYRRTTRSSGSVSRYGADLNLTPDSGISIAGTTPRHTPVDGTASSSIRGVLSSSPSAAGSGTNSSNNKTTTSRFQQKVARVRRNYRKKFADDSDSD